jgi:peptidoglycan/xylan/chitin deacetylase (PgdA/CDA1 family)
MTLYIPAYDTESDYCLAACKKIVEVHRRYEMPATFFICGRLLEESPREYRALLDDPLFEIASHTYKHRSLRDHAFCGPAVSEQEIREDIFLGKEWVEKVFERPCLGMRPGCGFSHGFSGAPNLLQLVREAGYSYLSSLLWGPLCSLPALLKPPFRYEADGFPDLWELPGHGWHENILKGNNNWGALRVLLFPLPMPAAIPTDYVKTPEEEFAFNNRLFIDQAVADNQPHVSLIWHPWSLNRFDPDMRMLEITFQYVREHGLEVGTFADLYARCAQSKE